MIRSLMLAAVCTAAVALTQDGFAQTRIIDLHLNAEGEGRAFGGSVVEGNRFHITFHGTGAFELLPVLVDENRGIYRVTVYRGPEGAGTDEMRAVETVTARVGVPVAIRSMPSVGLVIDGIRIAAVRSNVRGFAAMGAVPARSGECCVRCGNVTGCGCKVVHSCDTCCVDPCCAPPDPISNDRMFPRARSFAQMIGQCGEPIRDEERLFTTADWPTIIASTR